MFFFFTLSFHVITNAPFCYTPIQVCGSNGVVQANNPVDTAVTRLTAGGSTTDPLQFSFPQRYAQAYASEVDHLVDCILGE